MRALLIVLALALSTPAVAQERVPAAYRTPAPVGFHSVPPIEEARSDTSLSLGRHILVGVIVGVLATGAGFLIEGAVNDDAYDDCILCPIVVPIAIGAGGAAGGVGGAMVFAVRRLSARKSAPRAPR